MAGAHRLTRRVAPESVLADAWQDGGWPADTLVDSLGRRIQVVFPGRRWGGRGPDFRGAVLSLADGSLVRGDVEIHTRASGWSAHGHAADAEYTAVVLHVVAHVDAPTLDADGAPIPTLRLPALPPTRVPLPRPCLDDRARIQDIVAQAGRLRFAQRVEQLQQAARQMDADQVVWRGLLRALGYSHNTVPFERLADAVPWRLASQVVVEHGPLALAGLLLGAGGLIAHTTLAEAHAWRRFERHARARQAIPSTAWDTRTRHAANAPASRCRGAAELAARWTQTSRAGLAEQVLNAIRESATARRPVLWRFATAPPMIGRGRAQVVAINVLVPAAAAFGAAAQAAEVYERLPGEPWNRVMDYMAHQLGGRDGRRVFDRAHLRQGLLAIFRATCAARACEYCPAAARPATG